MDRLKHIWIIGFGRFGQHAARQIGERAPECLLTAVDPDMDLSRSRERRENLVQGDGMDFVIDRLADGERPDMIVPALPIHLAFEYVMRRYAAGRRNVSAVPVPESVAKRLPNAIFGAKGEVYVSHADFVCPDTCAEPASRCTVTGRERSANMFDLIDVSTGEYPSIVVRSRQLAPGVGGYAPDALFEAEKKIEWLSGTILLSTACRCHGVVHAVSVEEMGRRA